MREKMIKVKESTWKELMYLKINLGAGSIDEVINYLLNSAQAQGVAADA